LVSILIPVYNFEVSKLVADLHKQAIACHVPFEIICLDDHSLSAIRYLNQKSTSLKNVTYKYLDKNVGRAKIRNLLAQQAKYQYLLFVDCDTKVDSEKYIANYLKAMDGNAVIYGGTTYETQPPSDPKLYLRWYYGIKREKRSAKVRSIHPYDSFTIYNVLIPRTIYLSIKLNEKLKGYGHEDTLLGFRLKERDVPVIHIDNPLVHIGLETASDFIQKTEQGIKNLHFLLKEKLIQKEFISYIKLLKYAGIVQKWKLSELVYWFIHLFKKPILINLNSKHPRLYLFDLYKLELYLKLSEQDFID